MSIWDRPIPIEGPRGYVPVLPTDGRDNETRALEFVLFGSMGFASITLHGLPLGELALGLVTLVALTKRPTRVPPTLLISLILAIPAWMLVVSPIDHVTPYRRLLHLFLWALLAVCIGQGRIHMQTMARGLAAGMVVALGAGLLGVTAHTYLGAIGYAGRLTGFVGDPNVAGFYMLVLGLVACAYMGSRKQVLLFLVVATPLLLLTLSRTSLFAAAVCLLWLLIGHRVSSAFGVAALGAVVYAIAHFPARLKQIGPFRDRNGSDQLRERIDQGSALLVHSAGLTGHGPGTSHVPDGAGDFYFFHNSYESVINEGGWIGFAIVLALLVIAMLYLTRMPLKYRNGWVEAALISAAVVAINLGEVLLELPTAIALGAAAFHLSRPVDLHDDEPEVREELRWPF